MSAPRLTLEAGQALGQPLVYHGCPPTLLQDQVFAVRASEGMRLQTQALESHVALVTQTEPELA